MKNASALLQLETLAGVLGQVREIDKAVLRGMSDFYTKLTPAQRQEFVSNPSTVEEAVARAVAELLPKRIMLPTAEVERWQKYYSDEYGISCDLSGVDVPAEVDYPTRIIVMHEAISGKLQRIADVYKKRCGGKWWQFAPDLDVAVPKHARSGTYAIRVADVVEAPDGYLGKRNLSSQDTWDRGWVTTTLLERLVDGDMYLREHKAHLDQKVVMLCPGSRGADGDVPGVRLDDDGNVSVYCWDPDDARGCLRFRRAIV